MFFVISFFCIVSPISKTEFLTGLICQEAGVTLIVKDCIHLGFKFRIVLVMEPNWND